MRYVIIIPIVSLILAAILPATATEILLFNAAWEGNSEIYKSNVDGSEITKLTDDPANDREARISPDNNRVAFVSNRTGDFELFVMELGDLTVTQLTTTGVGGGQQEGAVAWSPDGSQLLYGNGRSLMIVNVDGTNPHQIAMAPVGRGVRYPEWSPAGNKLSFIAESPTWGYTADYYILNPDGSELQVIVANRPGREYGAPRFSPDGTKLAYTWDPSGHEETWGRLVDSRIYIFDLNTMLTSEVSMNKPANSNDMMASWSPDGSQILVNNWAAVPGDNAPRNLHVMNADGSNRELILENSWGSSWGIEAVGSPQEFFDDFTYRNRNELEGELWTILTGQNIEDRYPYYSNRVSLQNDPELSDNRILNLKARIQGDLEGDNPANSAGIQSVGDWFREGTYIARVRFDDGNADHNPFNNSDPTVQTFYTFKRETANPCNPASYSECDFEYYPYYFWDNNDHTASLDFVTWESYCSNPELLDRAFTRNIDTEGNLSNWNLLKLVVMGGQSVIYEVDNLSSSSIPHSVSSPLGNSVYPESNMYMFFENWVKMPRAEMHRPRETNLKVDWVYYCKNRILTIAEVEARVQELRDMDCPRLNTLEPPYIVCESSELKNGKWVDSGTSSNSDKSTFDQVTNPPFESLNIGVNPFNPTTTISYHIPQSGYVSLKIYNVQGREVSVLVEGFAETGIHQVTFDGSGLASGIYFARLEVGSIFEIKKLMLLK